MKTIIYLSLSLLLAPLGFVYLVVRALGGTWNWFAEIWQEVFPRSKPPPLWSASWATFKELKAGGHFKPGGFLMAVHKEKLKKIYADPERSAILIAPPGTGKSQHLIAYLHSLRELRPAQLPTLMIGDSALELYRATAPIFKELGYHISVLDLTDPTMGAKYDILTYLQPADRMRYDDNLRQLSEAMVLEEPNSRNPHFIDFARILLRGVITLNVMFEGNDKSISDIVAEIVVESKREKMFERCKAINNDHVQAAMGAFKKLQEKPEGLSIISTAVRKLETWMDEPVREMSNFGNGRGWSFEKVFTHDQPVVLFVYTGLSNASANYTRVMYANAINSALRYWDTHGKAMPREFRLIVDEAGLIGEVKAFVNGLARLRKVGFRMWLTFVSFQEFTKTYEEYETIWNGCDVAIYGGGKDKQLYEQASWFFGNRAGETKSRSESDHGSSEGHSETKVELITPDELRRLPFEETAVMLGNLSVKELKPFKRTKRGIVYL